MDEKEWMENNWSLEEIDIIDDTYYISFWLQEDLKKFIDLCFKFLIPMTFDPPYAVAIPKHRLEVLMYKVNNNEKKETAKDVFGHSLHATLH
ncbi:hypothetical protein [Methanobacterium formicicum]|uniref:hypothetical protein n=1 Tax=Methanobacterium formicicum TaxID=2162 RepID=UPI002412AE82|nr:hypothetical protein [Methanobacterium formicicum]MDG3546572.1 hypothetical protein [Methanobacterium formicicum]